jgi:hypothetical protein
MKDIIIDRWSFLVMAVTLIFSWLLFWSYTSDIFFSFLAALIAAFMIWLAYIGIRLLYFSLF